VRFQAFPEMGQREAGFPIMETVSPLLSRLYQQFVLTLKSELLYVCRVPMAWLCARNKQAEERLNFPIRSPLADKP
jgi:hypothetical protein